MVAEHPLSRTQEPSNRQACSHPLPATKLDDGGHARPKAGEALDRAPHNGPEPSVRQHLASASAHPAAQHRVAARPVPSWESTVHHLSIHRERRCLPAGNALICRRHRWMSLPRPPPLKRPVACGLLHPDGDLLLGSAGVCDSR